VEESGSRIMVTVFLDETLEQFQRLFDERRCTVGSVRKLPGQYQETGEGNEFVRRRVDGWHQHEESVPLQSEELPVTFPIDSPIYPPRRAA
jgi:hypothetical protein